MSIEIKDPIAEDYIAARAFQKKGHEVTIDLIHLLMQLGVWPWVDYKGRKTPLAGPVTSFRKFYQNKRRP